MGVCPSGRLDWMAAVRPIIINGSRAFLGLRRLQIGARVHRANDFLHRNSVDSCVWTAYVNPGGGA